MQTDHLCKQTSDYYKNRVSSRKTFLPKNSIPDSKLNKFPNYYQSCVFSKKKNLPRFLINKRINSPQITTKVLNYYKTSAVCIGLTSTSIYFLHHPDISWLHTLINFSYHTVYHYITTCNIIRNLSFHMVDVKEK